MRLLTGWLLLAMATAGCTSDEARLTRTTRSSVRTPRPSGGAIPLAACGSVTYEGCCDGETLWYCENSQLMSLQCSVPHPSCGWNPTYSYYDCSTGGGADPSGVNPISCAGFFGDAGPVQSDIGLQEGGPTADQGPTPDGSSLPGCVPTGTPGCGGCPCETCVCQLDAYCCTNQWDSICVGECINQCGGCGPAVDSGPKEASLPQESGPVTDLGPTPDASSLPGCVVTSTPGCGGCPCEACVCQMDSYCCANEWDSICVNECLTQCGGCGPGVDSGPKEGGPVTDLGPTPDASNLPGCVPASTPGCGGCACESCVCQMDSYCCANEWDSICVGECINQCGGCGPGGDGGSTSDLGPVDQAEPDMPKLVPLPDLAPSADQAIDWGQGVDQEATSDGAFVEGGGGDRKEGGGGGCNCSVSSSGTPDISWALLGLLLLYRRRSAQRRLAG